MMALRIMVFERGIFALTPCAFGRFFVARRVSLVVRKWMLDAGFWMLDTRKKFCHRERGGHRDLFDYKGGVCLVANLSTVEVWIIFCY